MKPCHDSASASCNMATQCHQMSRRTEADAGLAIVCNNLFHMHNGAGWTSQAGTCMMTARSCTICLPLTNCKQAFDHALHAGCHGKWTAVEYKQVQAKRKEFPLMCTLHLPGWHCHACLRLACWPKDWMACLPVRVVSDICFQSDTTVAARERRGAMIGT